ncbi:MAG: MBOAT family protein [Lachnospiraceae bacterium]|nr:MBOAT family protein [Lachnospiraceae bacterium]
MFSLSLTSLSYIIFVVVFVFVYYMVHRRFRWIVLLAASVLFFIVVSGAASIPWLLLGAATTYAGARLIGRMKKEAGKRAILAIVLVLVLGELFLLKYTRGLPFTAPIAVSFYSLSILGYVLDVYWGVTKAEENPFLYLLYVTYFPQMTSGPVTRYRLMQPQLREGAAFSYDKVKNGLIRIVYGMMKKCVIADLCAVMVSEVFGDTVTYQGAYVLLGVMLFALELYADFSGCMDIVLGTSECFGIELPENFDIPFSSVTMSEFWRRWHITLGVWFKDYVLYPLLKTAPFQKLNTVCVEKFGRKKGRKPATYLGLLAVWFLIGYWHGGAMHYVIGSGLLHWFYIVSGELFEEPVKKLTRRLHIDRRAKGYVLLQRLKVFFLVCSGFVFFRSETSYQACKMLYRMAVPFERGFFTGFSVWKLGLGAYELCFLSIGCAVMWTVSGFKLRRRDIRTALAGQHAVVRYAVYLLLCALVLLGMMRGFGADVSYFIYNKF